MSENAQDQKEQLFSTIWKLANELRGSVDGWDFKAYVLGMLFYRFISENFTQYVNTIQRKAGDEDYDYAQDTDEHANYGRDSLIAEKGFFILPSQLFENVCKRAEHDENLNVTLEKIFKDIEGSAKGKASEAKVKGLFDDFNTSSNKLGTTLPEKNSKLRNILRVIASLQLSGNYQNHRIDIFGDAYEYLMTMYADNAGKSGGEFFTPQEVSRLLAMLAIDGRGRVKHVYDPACGSGSLLLQFAKLLGDDNVMDGYYGQEINLTTYNLARINMFLHNISYNRFDLRHGDTLLNPLHQEEDTEKQKVRQFEAVVSNPPYSTKWLGDSSPTLKGDDRFTPAGVLAPKSKADLAFVMHILASLAYGGTAAVVEFPGVLYRSGAEQKIRKYLIEQNFVDCVIQLPPNLFFGVSIATCIIVLKKHRTPTDKVLFIEASEEYDKVTNKNRLAERHIEKIYTAYRERHSEKHFCREVSREEIRENDYNLAVNTYVEPRDTTPEIDIAELNDRLAAIQEKTSRLRAELDAIVKDLEA